jgi:hypothetical protein
MLKEPPEEKRQRAAHTAVERAIAEQVADTDPDAFEIRPPWPGAEPAWGNRKEPLPLPAVTAARRVMLQAMRAEREAIEHARGKGCTWTQIAHALGEHFVTLAKRADMPLTEAAWRYAAYRKLPDEEVEWSARWSGVRDTVGWRCWDCAQPVSEGHPDNGRDAERGHLPGCVRTRGRRR